MLARIEEGHLLNKEGGYDGGEDDGVVG